MVFLDTYLMTSCHLGRVRWPPLSFKCVGWWWHRGESESSKPSHCQILTQWTGKTDGQYLRMNWLSLRKNRAKFKTSGRRRRNAENRPQINKDKPKDRNMEPAELKNTRNSIYHAQNSFNKALAQSTIHNITQIQNNVLWDWHRSIECSPYSV